MEKSFWYKLGQFVGRALFVCISIIILGIAIAVAISILKLINWLWFV